CLLPLLPRREERPGERRADSARNPLPTNNFGLLSPLRLSTLGSRLSTPLFIQLSGFEITQAAAKHEFAQGLVLFGDGLGLSQFGFEQQAAGLEHVVEGAAIVQPVFAGHGQGLMRSGKYFVAIQNRLAAR